MTMHTREGWGGWRRDWWSRVRTRRVADIHHRHFLGWRRLIELGRLQRGLRSAEAGAT